MFKIQYGGTNKVLNLLKTKALTQAISLQIERKKGKGLSETVRPGKARRWSDAEVDRSRAIFWANQYDTGLSFKDSG